MKPVIIGRFGRTHGVKGWIYVISFTHPVDNILNYQPWSTLQRGTLKPLPALTIHNQGGKLMAKFDSIDTPEEARLYTNQVIAISHKALPKTEEDEYYWNDLIGMTVIDQSGQTLGRVDHLFNTGSNDILVLKRKSHEIQIPFLKKTILNVNLDTGIINVHWNP